MNGKSRTNRFLIFLRIALFCALLCFCVFRLSRLLERKEGRARMAPFFEHPEDFDVLITGDSQVINGLYPFELWRRFGITSYNVGEYGATPPLCYWTLMNFLDYAKPKLVVVGVKDADKTYRLSGSSEGAHTALDCLPASPTKARAIFDLMNHPDMEDEDGVPYRSLMWEYFFPLATYHSRWKELKPEDLRPAADEEKGAEMLVRVNDPREYELIDPDETDEGEGWGYVYLRRLITECRARGIDVLPVLMPHPASEHTQRSAGTVRRIARETGVAFLDFVQMDSVADYRTDMHDPKAHLNPSGARKVTDFLGRYIADHYNVRDRREDALSERWNREADAYTDRKLALIREQEDYQNALMLLHDPDFSACVFVRDAEKLRSRDRLLMQNIMREHVFEENEEELTSADQTPLWELDYAAETGGSYLLTADRWYAQAQELAAPEGALETSFGRIRLEQGEDGPGLFLSRGEEETRLFQGEKGGTADLLILVIDERTGEPAVELCYGL